MASTLKPESALKRAAEFELVGKKQDALETLHNALQNKRFRNMWTLVMEQIMVKFLGLCVELKKMRTAREGLHQYRAMCQGANVGSLEVVVKSFRLAAEKEVADAKKLSDDKALAQIGDLDDNPSPQAILLNAIQASDTRTQSQDRDVHEHFRFLWDTYKAILDILKAGPKLEDVYHETAKHAFEFCLQNQRQQEFKRLCETLRRNYEQLLKRSGPVSQHQVDPNNPETINRTLETKCAQLQVATKLDMWRESYTTAEDIHHLMAKAHKPRSVLKSMYFNSLGEIFWKSENYLFHAFACLKNLLLIKALKPNLAKDELTLLSSKAVLATLCVPFAKKTDLLATLETGGTDGAMTRARANAALFSSQSVPTRDSILQQVTDKGLLQFSAEPCQKLFALIESDFTPLSLCQDAKPYLDQLTSEDFCEGALAEYAMPLKQIIFFRLMKQLSDVYANMTIQNFERAASIVPFAVSEKWLANNAKAHGISVQINYREMAIIFGAPRKVDMKNMRQPLIQIGKQLQEAMNRVNPEDQTKRERLEKQELSSNISGRLAQELKAIRQRKDEIERRKEEKERRQKILEREQLEKERKEHAIEAERERKRQEEERRRREVEKEEQRRKDAELTRNKEILEQMKRGDTSAKVKVSTKDGSKKITEMTAEDLEQGTIGIDQIERARQAQMSRERQEKIRQRKMEAKRIDHLGRAIRQEEREKLQDWGDFIHEKDGDFIELHEEKMAEKQRVAHEAGLEEKRLLSKFVEAKQKWVDEQLGERWEEFQKKSKEQISRCEQIVVENKIKRARTAKAKFDEEKAVERKAQEAKRRAREEEEERLRDAEAAEERARRRRQQEEEEEERRQAEEEAERERKEERKRQREAERAEQDEANKRAAEKRLAKEREIEERQAAERAERSAAREAPREAPRRGADDDRWGSKKKDDDDSGSWRRPAAAAGGRDDKPAGASQPWRSRRDAERDEAPREERPANPWRRNADRDEGSKEGGSWRDRQSAKDDEAPKESSWRDRQSARGAGDDEPKKENPWRRDARTRQEPREEPKAEEPRAASPPKQEAAAPDEDDDGFETVQAGKKKKSAAAKAEPEAARPAPWRRDGPARDAPRDGDRPATTAPWRRGGAGAGGKGTGR